MSNVVIIVLGEMQAGTGRRGKDGAGEKPVVLLKQETRAMEPDD